MTLVTLVTETNKPVMGCVDSRQTRLTEVEDGGHAPIESIEQWARMLTSRSVAIDFRDDDNRTFYEESDFVAECVGLHNHFRHRHRAPPLRLSPTLCHSAQSWANHLAHTGYFYHQNLPDVGENIYCRRNYLQDDVDLTGKEVIDCWYRGNGHYNHDLEPEVLHVNAGAFTQMVWIGTREVGLGKARSREGKYVAVANYRPAGNVPGHFHDNVARSNMIRCGDEVSARVTLRAVLRRQYYSDGQRRRMQTIAAAAAAGQSHHHPPYTIKLQSRVLHPVAAIDNS